MGMSSRRGVLLVCIGGRELNSALEMLVGGSQIRRDISYLRRRGQIRLHLEALPEVHQTLIDLSRLLQSLPLGLRISSPLTPSQIYYR